MGPSMAASATSPVERLSQRLRPHRTRRMSLRELRTELASTALLGAVVAAMAVLLPGGHAVSALDLFSLIALHAACSHIRLYVGGGSEVPTQLALVPMLFLLPPALVPVAVATGLCLATAVELGRGEAGPDRLLAAIGDAWHAVGPALVFAAAGSPEASASAWPLLVPALVAQATTDSVSSLLREQVGRGIPAALQLRVMGWVYAVDALLTPVAFLAVVAPVAGGHGWLLLLPLCVVFSGLVSDRRARIETELARIEDLRRERARLQAVMRRVGRTLTANLDREAMLGAVLETAREAMAATHGCAGVPGASGSDPPSAPAALALRNAGRQALRTGMTATSTVAGWHAVARRIGRGEALALTRRSSTFADEEIEILEHLVAHATISLENAELHARVREQASTDGLTGLPNHRTLQTRLAEQLEGTSLVLFDLDDFKHVNDTHGHLAGDQVLRAVAQLVRERCRAVDLPARYGGEELAVALPRTGAAGALTLAEDVRRAVAGLEIGDGIRITVSAGVAAADDCSTPQDLIAAADAALYEAKRSGKNRTMVARSAAALA